MMKHFEISKNGQRLGSIIAETIVCDNEDNYLLFMDKGHCVAMFPAESIELSVKDSKQIECVNNFAEYQSNRI